MVRTAPRATLSALERLAWSRPRPDAPTEVVAAWPERKVAVHEALAAEATDADERAAELGYAHDARRHARALTARAAGEAPVVPLPRPVPPIEGGRAA